ncbi:MAG: antibiotic biosynthesis monooxygenase [Alphaproteobacteria bacterium]|nr:antibiotic biosynthesis monooxygenase [Alphaproteobacteria bacterium]
MRTGCYAVIFTSRLGAEAADYALWADRIEALARNQPGYLGHDSLRDQDGLGITVSYWNSEDAIARWRAHAEHATARSLGRERFYDWFRLDVCRVTRTYGFGER